MLREQANYSQTDLANFLNIDRSEISRIENGKRKPSRSIVYKYTKFFEVDIDFLDKEQMSIHSIRLPKTMVQELLCSFEQYGSELSNIIRNLLQEALDTNGLEKQQTLLTRLIHNAMMEKSIDEIKELKQVEINQEYVKIAIMECFAHMIHASDADKEELESMILKNAKNRVYKR